MFFCRLASRSTLLAVILAAVALCSTGASRSAEAAYEYDAAINSYYGHLYGYYAALYEDVDPNDDSVNMGYYFSYYGYAFCNMGYQGESRENFYYGAVYTGYAYSYMYQAYANHGGTYTDYSCQAMVAGIAYAYAAYYQ